jgi:hypothetical protein
MEVKSAPESVMKCSLKQEIFGEARVRLVQRFFSLLLSSDWHFVFLPRHEMLENTLISHFTMVASRGDKSGHDTHSSGFLGKK